MALNLSNVTYNSNVTQNVNSSAQVGLGNSAMAQNQAYQAGSKISVPGNLTAAQAGNVLLSNLSNGDSFTGEITNITQNQITIALSDSVNITATLSNALSYNIGDMASFTIKEHSGSQIILQSNPNAQLSQLMQDQTIHMALSNAGLPASESNVSLVHEMMKQSISIDADTLNHYASAMESAPSATPEDTVLLTKMGIPVTEENVSALHDYYQYSEGATQKASQLSSSLSDALFNTVSAGDNRAEQGLATTAELPANATASNSPSANMVDTEATTFLNELNSAVSHEQVSEAQTQAGALLKDFTSSFSETLSTPEPLKEQFGSEEREGFSQLIKALATDAEAVVEETGQNTPKVEIQTSNTALKEFSEQIKTGDMTAKEFLQGFSEILSKEPLEASTLKDFLSSKEFHTLTEAMLRQEMFIKPEDVTKENVKKLMSKLLTDTNMVSEKLGTQTGTEALVNTANQVKQDITFLNQVNQFMNFVQIPVKMSGQNTHGDLYVYKNHKGGSGDDQEELKAFLHLDMDHLGPLDVMVKLQHKNVSTDFKVESEEILDFIESHINELNTRLEQLGFHVNSVVEKNDGNYSFKKDVIEEEMPPVEIKRFSFDVRA